LSNYLADLALEIRAEVGEDATPPGDADSLFRIYAVLVLAKGVATNGEDVHNAWVAWISSADPAHEAARPYDDLDDATRREDEPFVAAIRKIASRT
jgi:hypothetical protein